MVPEKTFYWENDQNTPKIIFLPLFDHQRLIQTIQRIYPQILVDIALHIQAKHHNDQIKLGDTIRFEERTDDNYGRRRADDKQLGIRSAPLNISLLCFSELYVKS